MTDGISPVTNGQGVPQPDRVSPKKDREREEQLDFAEEMEHRSQGEDPEGDAKSEELPPTPGISRGGTRAVGYRSDEEAGGGLDLSA
ncbi:MAG: hypothetical protein OSB10_00840 [Planctomycetota bacterium]|jgi:hypothetical protein|nr:hypothetical protein [Planctomycetota bacterium]